MKSFLGVPILQRGVAYGNLYLTEKEGGEPFTDEDVELTQLLAAQAAVAIENARLYESATRWLRQFETLNEIGNALASELELTPLLELVARRLRELIDARLVLIALPGPAGGLEVAAADGDGRLRDRGHDARRRPLQVRPRSSSAPGASGSTRSSRITRSTSPRFAGSASVRACTFRSWSADVRSA